MKKTKVLAVLSAFFLLTACGEHTHTFSDTWKADEEQHWHEATCEHKSIKAKTGAHTFGTAEVIDGEKKVTCTTCGYVKDFNPNDVEHSDGFSDVTEFDDAIEIHTDRQKTFLAYTGDYSKMPQADYPNGDATISDPIRHTISWDFEDHNDVSKYSITIGSKKDLSDGFEIMGTTERSISAYNFFLGTNYYRINAYMGEDKVGSDVYKVEVDSTVPRNLYVGERMTNCRDVGGKELTSGGKIKQGLLYRTCGSGYDYGSKMTAEGEEILTKQLKVKTEINLNDSGSYNANLEGVKIYDTFMDYNAQQANTSRHHFARNTENVRNVFDILSRKESYPTFFHCRIGTDRTGLIAILVNGVLGVPLNNIYQDYLFSNFGKIGTKRNIGTNDDDDITKYMSEIMSMPGESFQEQVYNTLLTIGVTPEIIQSVKDILIEGEQPDNNNGQVVVNAKDMTLSGTTLVTEDKTSLVARTSPASYAVMSANATATCNFTTSSGEKTIYGYLGHYENSTSKKVEDSIQVTLDGNTVTIPSINFNTAGVGHCGNNRTNYYFVKLGTVNITSAGEHSIVVKGLTNDMHLANIAVF